ncbi:MAG: SDR family NAD(P)-dependent oxidoreductase [Anaerolineae bacterium]|nr:SDR family NAD(P)-dependent oxidoreductase [Anaerolineae bacterium]
MDYNLENKTIIVTGANSGIGKAAAIQLAALGATVIMACRTLERGEKALEEVKALSKSEKVVLMKVDMSSQTSIKNFADTFITKYRKLDVLIHNAANFDHTLKTPVLTEDKIETVFATNHVGIVLMTHLLLDLLKKSAPSRIITVASKGLIMYPLLDIEFDNLNGERKFNMQHAYYHSKLAQVMYTYDLAEQLKETGVSVNCVRVTNVAFPDERLTHLPVWMRKIYNLKRKMAITPERQAETYVYLAAASEVEKISGGYWDENNKQVNSSKNSYNKATWHKLREVTEKMAGIK